jgi:hypothetical protein
MSFPLMVRAIRLSLEAVDQNLEDAASSLGAKAADRFLTITLPLCEQSPIGPGNVAALHGIIPQHRNGDSILGLGELVDSKPVLAIEGLVEVLRAPHRTSGNDDSHLVQAVVFPRVGAMHIEPAQELPQFSRRQARPDDGAVQTRVEFPNPRPLL